MLRAVSCADCESVVVSEFTLLVDRMSDLLEGLLRGDIGYVTEVALLLDRLERFKRHLIPYKIGLLPLHVGQMCLVAPSKPGRPKRAVLRKIELVCLVSELDKDGDPFDKVHRVGIDRLTSKVEPFLQQGGRS